MVSTRGKFCTEYCKKRNVNFKLHHWFLESYRKARCAQPQLRPVNGQKAEQGKCAFPEKCKKKTSLQCLNSGSFVPTPLGEGPNKQQIRAPLPRLVQREAITAKENAEVDVASQRSKKASKTGQKVSAYVNLKTSKGLGGKESTTHSF